LKIYFDKIINKNAFSSNSIYSWSAINSYFILPSMDKASKSNKKLRKVAQVTWL